MTHTLCLAPLQGLTDHHYRNLFFRFFSGFDLALAPFIPTRKGSRNHHKTFHSVLPENNVGFALIPQLLGNDADEFILAATRLHDLGYPTINWNLGCPYPMVAKKQRGSGLLPYPDKIEAFLDRVLSAIPNALSIKTRLGRFSPDELFRLMPIFNRFPLDCLIVHPRTGVQMYEGTPDLDAFKTVLSLSACPVVYNGDIVHPQTFAGLSRRFPAVTRWMIGRGALADPFLPADIRGALSLTSSERLSIIRQFLTELYQTYQHAFFGPAHPLDRMKGLWRYLAGSFNDGQLVLKNIQRSRSAAQYESVLERFFQEQPRWLGSDKET